MNAKFWNITKLVILSVIILISFCSSKCTGRRQMVSSKSSPQVVADNIKPVVNVYIENSSSMDGYVRDVTEFEQAVYNYLSDIKISQICDSLNLFYINSELIPQGSDIEDFINKLEPSTFKARGGNRGTSDISNVLKKVLKETKSNNVAILITDGIFSPGKNVDAKQYLINQQIGIKGIFSEYLRQYKNTAVIVYQLQSSFNGKYYNNVDIPLNICEKRPYYIWLIGNANQLCKIREKIPDDKLQSRNAVPYLNVFMAMNGVQPVDYSIKPSSGKFELSRNNPNTDLMNLKKDKRTGKVEFSVNVDFSHLLLAENYLLDPKNYENDSKYNLSIKKSVTQSGNYTHILCLSADRVYAGPVSIKLKADLPSWIEEANDDIGVRAVNDKTYGIKYQLRGVFEAFTFSNKCYAEIKININK